MGLMNRFEYIPGSHKPKLMRNGAIFLGLITAVFLWAFMGGTIPFLPKDGYTVKAEFATAANVTTKTPVRMRGVDVGKVEKVERRGDGQDGVVITMRIDDDEVDLKRDARADILWRTLLGFAFYIQLEPGAEQEDLGNATIPMDRTTTQVELDQVLAAVDRPSRDGIQRIFTEFDEGFDEAAGSEAGETIDNLGPAMKQVGPGLDALRGNRNGDLNELVENTSRLMGALARNEMELGQVISNANTTLGVTAARRADIGSLLEGGPETLRQTRTTMARLRTTFDVLDPVAEDLRPGVRRIDEASDGLRPALRSLRPLLTSADPLLEDLRPAFTRLGRASEAGVPLLDRLDPAVKRLNDKLIPRLNKRNEDITGLKLYEAIGPTVTAVDHSASQFDVNGHIQRFNAVAGGEQTIASIPCTSDLLSGGGVNCDEFQAIIGGLIGLTPGPASAKSGARSRVADRTTPAKAPSVAKTRDKVGSAIDDLADALGGVL